MASFNHDPLGQARFDAPTSPTSLTLGTEGFLIDLAPGHPLYIGVVSPAPTTYLGPVLPLVGTFTMVAHTGVTILSVLEAYLAFECPVVPPVVPPVVYPPPGLPPPPPSSGFLNPGNSGITYRKRVYVHKYFFRNSGDGSERAQSSWSHWEFSGVSEILQILVIEEVLYLLMEYPNGEVWLERMRVADRAVDDDSAQALLLDRRVSTTQATPATLRVAAGAYNGGTNTTSWTLPYAASSPVEAWSAYGGAWSGGVLIGTAASGSSTVTAAGDWSGADVFFGEAYEFQYRFTRFKAMKEVGGGKAALNERRTQIRSAKLRFHDTGHFEVRVSPEARATSIYRYDSPSIDGEGLFSIPILSQGSRCDVELRNATARPCKFLSCEWVGLVSSRVRGML